MTATKARSLLLEHLAPRYGDGEARAIARIVLEDAFSEEDDEQLYKILERLVAGEPVQYVLGQADFFGLKFKVNPAVLIPRQETEELVAWILEHLKNSRLENPSLLDIGLGSGCIGVTLKKKYPRLQLFGLEKSAAALEVATGNARRILGENVPFLFAEGDILDYHAWANFPLFDVVVSNPPYIPLVEKSMMPEHVTAHEPALALFVDDTDPLLFYRAIADFALQKLRPDGALFFECNEFNASEVAALLREKGFVETELQKDLAGAERMLRAVRPAG
ncbi:MAG: peptide chain release factor N(5)-glutamine methyltransferase [Saprospiraceae bacterium]